MKVKYELKEPVEYSGKEYTSLEIETNPRGIHMRGISATKLSNGDFGEIMRFVASLSGTDLPIIEKMTVADILGAMAVYGETSPLAGSPPETT